MGQNKINTVQNILSKRGNTVQANIFIPQKYYIYNHMIKYYVLTEKTEYRRTYMVPKQLQASSYVGTSKSKNKLPKKDLRIIHRHVDAFEVRLFVPRTITITVTSSWYFRRLPAGILISSSILKPANKIYRKIS